MKLLEPDQYHKVLEPLKRLRINSLFGRSVVENHVKGSIYVDDPETPEAFHIVHPYNMSLLFGKPNNEDFNAKFRDYALNVHKVRQQHEWMQAFPDAWDSVLARLFDGRMVKAEDNLKNNKPECIELNTRVNFKFNVDTYLVCKSKGSNKLNFDIVRTDKSIYKDMKGSVVPMYFWNNAEDFDNKGVGFSLFYEGHLASTAFSSYIHGNQLEIGIETVSEYRGMGLAQYSCSALIDYCLENNYEPVWSCRLENPASYKLAQKLGFEETIRLPYYRLCAN